MTTFCGFVGLGKGFCPIDSSIGAPVPMSTRDILPLFFFHGPILTSHIAKNKESPPIYIKKRCIL